MPDKFADKLSDREPSDTKANKMSDRMPAKRVKWNVRLDARKNSR